VINISKYGKIVGKLKLDIEGFDKELTPKVGDGRKFMKLITKAETDKDLLFDGFAIFVTDIIAREYPPENDKETEELGLFVDMNLLTLLNEFMVGFGLTTREALEQQKKELLQVTKKR